MLWAIRSLLSMADSWSQPIMSPAQTDLPAQRAWGTRRVNRHGWGGTQLTPTADKGEFFDTTNVSDSDEDTSPCPTPITPTTNNTTAASPPDSNDAIPAQTCGTLPVALSATSTDPLLDTSRSSNLRGYTHDVRYFFEKYPDNRSKCKFCR